jgi:segregation and condensation protein A
MAAMPFEVRTRVFEGPLDLLLQLITSHQLEITELSLVDIVNEYLTYIDDMADLDMEVTSEFLLIAATMIQLKARHLLPEDEPFDLDEELALASERDRLLARLLASLTFKDVAAVLRHRLEASERHVPRAVGLPPEITPFVPEVVLPVDLAGFCEIAERVFTAPFLDPDIDHLDLDVPSVQDAMLDLQGRMASVITSDFEEVVAHCTRDAEVIAYFLALLEPQIALAYDEAAADQRFRAILDTEGAS